MEAAEGLSGNVLGIGGAPDVSPEGGRNCYAVTYQRLAASPALTERKFIVLDTSHWAVPGKFGLTRKPFVTPLRTLRADTELLDWLEQHGGQAVSPEDYCHAIEHSIEFQRVFLQHALASELKIVPKERRTSFKLGQLPDGHTAVTLPSFAEELIRSSHCKLRPLRSFRRCQAFA